MLQKFVLLITLLTITQFTNAQKITGVIKDEQGSALVKATVSLCKAKDSAVVKLAITDNDGNFSFKPISGNYFITVSNVGFKTYYSKPFNWAATTDLLLGNIGVSKMVKALEGVTVTSKKPMIEVAADKTIVNVEGTINAVGSTALDLLRKSPGVTLDNDDNISLSGKNGVQVFIDGKPSPLTGADLATFLQSLQSAQIEAIELITNPSAKYEAAGNAGIINIRLKKNKSFGTNGSINAGYAIGVYGKYNGGLSLNRRNSKANIFGNYNFNHAKNVGDFRLNRNVGDSFFSLVSNRLQISNTHGFKTGIDFFINKKSTLGFLVNGTIADNLPDNFSKTTIGYTPTNTINRLLIADNKNHTTQNNVNFNSNYHYIDANGHDLNIDADYGLFRNTNNQNQPNYYYNAAGTTELSHAIYSFVAPTNIDIYSLKIDYEQNFKKGKLGIGGKASYVKTNNHFERYDVTNTGNVLDVLRSNQFNYTENVNALYLNYNRKYKTIVVQFGVRAENTVSDGQSYSLNANGSVNYAVVKPFKRSYLDFFPSAAITFNKNPQNQWSVAYGRRIDRPNYQFLNPFEFKLDEYNYRKGNPDLQPQYTNSISITNLYKTKLVTKLSYSHVKDVFAQITDTIETNKSFITNKNLATQNIISLGVSYPFQYKWYTGFVTINSFYSNYKADFGGGNRVINLDVFAYTCNLQNSLKLGNGFIGEINGFYNSPTIWQGTFKSKAQGGVDAGMQKNIWQGKATIKASVTDIFLTQAFNAENDFAGQKSNVFIQNENRQFKINFTYRFGSNQVKAARNRSTGSEDESKRSQGGGQ